MNNLDDLEKEIIELYSIIDKTYDRDEIINKVNTIIQDIDFSEYRDNNKAFGLIYCISLVVKALFAPIDWLLSDKTSWVNRILKNPIVQLMIKAGMKTRLKNGNLRSKISDMIDDSNNIDEIKQKLENDIDIKDLDKDKFENLASIFEKDDIIKSMPSKYKVIITGMEIWINSFKNYEEMMLLNDKFEEELSQYQLYKDIKEKQDRFSEYVQYLNEKEIISEQLFEKVFMLAHYLEHRCSEQLFCCDIGNRLISEEDESDLLIPVLHYDTLFSVFPYSYLIEELYNRSIKNHKYLNPSLKEYNDSDLLIMMKSLCDSNKIFVDNQSILSSVYLIVKTLDYNTLSNAFNCDYSYVINVEKQIYNKTCEKEAEPNNSMIRATKDLDKEILPIFEGIEKGKIPPIQTKGIRRMYLNEFRDEYNDETKRDKFISNAQEYEKANPKDDTRLLMRLITMVLSDFLNSYSGEQSDKIKEDVLHIIKKKQISDLTYYNDILNKVAKLSHFNKPQPFFIKNLNELKKKDSRFNATTIGVNLLYLLLHYKDSSLESVYNTINLVREQQKEKLDCLPNRYIQHISLNEAKKVKKFHEKNMSKLRELDVGFNIYYKQENDYIQLIDPESSIERPYTLKVFPETDKRIRNININKEPDTNNFKINYDEVYRVSNKNNITNYYLYNNRNMKTHFSTHKTIEQLLSDEKSKVQLLEALFDIKDYFTDVKQKKSDNNYTFVIQYYLNAVDLCIDQIISCVIPEISKNNIEDKISEVTEMNNGIRCIKKSYQKRFTDFCLEQYLKSEYLDLLKKCLNIAYCCNEPIIEKYRFEITLYLMYISLSLGNKTNTKK